MWTVIFCALSAAIAAASCLGAFLSARRAAHDVELPLVKLRSIESRTVLTERSLNDVSEVLTELSNRVKMMKVRGSLRHQDASPTEPDPYKDPDGWRNMMNRKLAAAKLNGG
jgi:hypothetical protein